MVVVTVSAPATAVTSDAVRFTVEKAGQPALVRTHPGALTPDQRFGLPGIPAAYHGSVKLLVELLQGTCVAAATPRVDLQLAGGGTADAGKLQPTATGACGAGSADGGLPPDAELAPDTESPAADASAPETPPPTTDAGVPEVAPPDAPPVAVWRLLVRDFMSPDKPSLPRLAPISNARTLLAWRTGAGGEGVSVVDLPDQVNRTFRAKTSAVAGNGLGFAVAAESTIAPFAAWGEDTKVVVKRGDAADPALSTVTWNQVGEPFGATGATSPALCPTIAIHDTGVVAVAFSQGTPLRSVQLRRLNGAAWEFVTPIDPATGNNAADCPIIAARGPTSLAAAWVGTAPDQTRRVFVQRWVDMNRWEAWGTPLGSGQAETLTLGGLVLDGAGLPTVAWHELRQGQSTVFVRRWDEAGKAWVDLGGAMSLGVPAASAPPALALDRGAGATPLLAWFDTSTGRPAVAVWKLADGKWERIGNGVLRGMTDGTPTELSLASVGGVPYVAFVDVTAGTRLLNAYTLR